MENKVYEIGNYSRLKDTFDINEFISFLLYALLPILTILAPVVMLNSGNFIYYNQVRDINAIWLLSIVLFGVIKSIISFFYLDKRCYSDETIGEEKIGFFKFREIFIFEKMRFWVPVLVCLWGAFFMIVSADFRLLDRDYYSLMEEDKGSYNMARDIIKIIDPVDSWMYLGIILMGSVVVGCLINMFNCKKKIYRVKDKYERKAYYRLSSFYFWNAVIIPIAWYALFCVYRDNFAWIN